MYTYLMLPAAVRAEVPAVAMERRERREQRARHFVGYPQPRRTPARAQSVPERIHEDSA
jgi:hypothetical protein